MNTYARYQNTGSIISLSVGELIVYLVLAFLLGYMIHYIFSRRRTYVKTSRKNYYYPNTEPVFPPRYY
jgi:hypothetical protein